MIKRSGLSSPDFSWLYQQTAQASDGDPRPRDLSPDNDDDAEDDDDHDNCGDDVDDEDNEDDEED